MFDYVQGPEHLFGLANSTLFPLPVHSTSQGYVGASDLLYSKRTRYYLSNKTKHDTPVMTLRCKFTKLPFYWRTSPNPPNSCHFRSPDRLGVGLWDSVLSLRYVGYPRK